MKKEYEIEDSLVSFEIHPERPPEGIPAERQFSPAKYQSMMASLRSRGGELGISFGERPLLANSRLAIEASEYAKDKGRHPEFSDGIFQAYFTDGRNIGEMDVILDVASASGLNREEVRHVLSTGGYSAKRTRNAAEASRLGIDSVPTFVINERYQLVGAQPSEAFRSLFARLERG